MKIPIEHDPVNAAKRTAEAIRAGLCDKELTALQFVRGLRIYRVRLDKLRKSANPEPIIKELAQQIDHLSLKGK